jgi:hypothetical protein
LLRTVRTDPVAKASVNANCGYVVHASATTNSRPRQPSLARPDLVNRDDLVINIRSDGPSEAVSYANRTRWDSKMSVIREICRRYKLLQEQDHG